MQAIRRAVSLLLFIAAAPAQADAVADWNRIALDSALRSDQPLEYHLRAMATVHVAMFEALNFVEARYRPHFVVGSAGLRGLPGDAVAAAAAHYALDGLYPEQRGALAEALKASAALLPAGRNGFATGSSISASIRAMTIRGSEPWLLDSAGLPDAFPPRGPQQARLAGEQDANLHSDTSPLSWNSRVAALASASSLGALERARLHALVSMAIADAYAVTRESGHRCAQCIATPAVAAILESELGTRLDLPAERPDKLDQDMARQISRYALQRYRAR